MPFRLLLSSPCTDGASAHAHAPRLPALAARYVQAPGGNDSSLTVASAIMYQFWSLFGYYGDLTVVSAESAPIALGSVNIGPMLIWIYSFIADVLLMNLLIAMMADSFNRVQVGPPASCPFTVSLSQLPAFPGDIDGRLTLLMSHRWRGIPPHLNRPSPSTVLS